MSTRSTKKWKSCKHAKISERTLQLIEQKKRLAGASLALMLSTSGAVITETATIAFADEPEDAVAAEAANASEVAPEPSADAIALAETSLTACTRALTTDLGTGSSLTEVATYDPAAERAAQVEALVDAAYSHLGTPYRYGGTTPAGFDCSGFTGYVYNQALGMELPRTAAGQSGLGESISLDEAKRGDLIFWGGRGGVYHTGIYLGDGEYIHAAASGCVQITSVGTYAPSFAMRLI